MQNRCGAHLRIVCSCIETWRFWQNMIWSGFFLWIFLKFSFVWWHSRQTLYPRACFSLSPSSRSFHFRNLNSHFGDYASYNSFSDSSFRSYRYSISFFLRADGANGRDRSWHDACPITNVKSIFHCREIGEAVAKSILSRIERMDSPSRVFRERTKSR